MRRLPAEVVPRVPEPVRKVARTAIWGFGRATSRWRPLPDFLVIGAQKAGTTALYAYLRWHPGITGPSWKEVSFFDRHWWRGRGVVPRAVPAAERDTARRRGEPELPLPPARTGARPLARARRASSSCSSAIPVARAYSHYQHEVALGREPLSFEDALAAEDERTRGEEASGSSPTRRAFSRAWWDHTYVARGLYADQLERWLAVFPREQLLVVRTEDLGERPAETYAEILAFLGAAPHALEAYPRVFDREYAADARRRRGSRSPRRFAEPNRRLEALLGRDSGGWRVS